MLTTAGAALRAAPLKLPVAGCEVVLAGASSNEMPAPERVVPRPSQSGWSVATTKYAATSTVTVWEKISQSRVMNGVGVLGNGVQGGLCQAFACALSPNVGVSLRACRAVHRATIGP